MTRVRITYYTDPLCSWSWAMEPSWRRLRFEFGEQLSWRYRMGGLISDSDRFEDPLNSVHRPAQWAPQWYEVSQTSGMPLDERVWYENPPASSYPACVAVKAVQRQSADLAEAYLRRLREAAMLERVDIAREEVLEEMAARLEGLDFDRFLDDIRGPARGDFREDLKDAGYHRIGRFPALIMEPAAGSSRKLLIVGWRPYEVLRKAVEKVAPDIEPVRQADDPTRLVEAWGAALADEVVLMCDGPAESVPEVLEAAVREARLVSTSIGNAPVFHCPA